MGTGKFPVDQPPAALPPVRFPGGFVRGSLPGGRRRALRAAGGACGPPRSPSPARHTEDPSHAPSLPLPGSGSLPAAPSGDTGTCRRPQAGEAGGQGRRLRPHRLPPRAPCPTQPLRRPRNPGADPAGGEAWRETGFRLMGRFWSREKEAHLGG